METAERTLRLAGPTRYVQPAARGLRAGIRLGGTPFLSRQAERRSAATAAGDGPASPRRQFRGRNFSLRRRRPPCSISPSPPCSPPRRPPIPRSTIPASATSPSASRIIAASRLVGWDAFAAAAAEPDALILDARSASAFAQRPYQGRGQPALHRLHRREPRRGHRQARPSDPDLLQQQFQQRRAAGAAQVGAARAQHPDLHQPRRLRLSPTSASSTR